MTDQAGDPRDSNAWRCKCNGCPLPWTHPTDWHEPARRGERRRPRWGVCDYHRQAEGGEWMATTARINEQLRMLKLMHAVRGLVDDECKPLDFETVPAWLARLDAIMRRRILPSAQPVAVSDDALQALKRAACGGDL